MARKVKAKKAAAKVANRTRATAQKVLPMTTFNQLLFATGSFWLSSTLLILVADFLFAREVVLGTHLISPLMAAVYAGGIVGLISVSLIPIIEFLSVELKLKLSNLHWIVLYFFINTGAIWLVTRFSELIGMGISAWWVAVVLGMVFNLVQGWLMMSVVNKIK